MKKSVISVVFIMTGLQLMAQEKTSITFGTNGISIENEDDQKKRKSNFNFFTFDLGVNFINDQTNYNDPATKAFLDVPSTHQNESLFSLRSGKSINFNIYPVLFNAPIYTGDKQKISLYTGAGLQVYNFKFNKDIQFINDPTPAISMSSLDLNKNKLSVMYASIPLTLLFKTKVASKAWLVYGFGIMGGVNVSTWTKIRSAENGKEKNHDMFNLQSLNLNLTGEIGINNFVRLFGTYQLTNLYKNSLIHNPYVIGLRFDGI